MRKEKAGEELNMYFNKVGGKRTGLVVVMALFMFAALLWADLPVAQAENMTIRWFQPEATLISSDDNSVLYKLNAPINPDKVHLKWNFSNGLDRPLADDLQYIALKTKDETTVISLNKGIPPFKLDSQGIIAAGDFKYTKIGGGSGKTGDKSNELRLLELILKSTSLQPGTTYIIELAPGFQANNGNTLGLTYSWEFTTSGKAPIEPPAPAPAPKEEVSPDTETSLLPEYKDIKTHWARTSIDKLVAAGAISGYPDGSFRPDNPISRAEFATMLVKAFKLEAKNGKVFKDTANHWAKDAIAAAAANGIVSGYDADTFAPNEFITREQMAVMVVRAARLGAVTGVKDFSDSQQIAEWARDAVNKATGHKIMSGYPDNSFRPGANASRAQAVTIIAQASQ